MATEAKTWKALLATAFALAMCFALAACSGSASNSSAASGSASASGSAAASDSSASASSSADPTAKFVGEWKAAALESNGLTIVGDFGALLGTGSAGMSLNLKADGTGSMAYGSESGDFTWTASGDNKITIKPVNQDTTMDIEYANDMLSMNMDDPEFSGKLFLTKDGTYEGVKSVDLATASPITSEGQLIGEWKFAGAGAFGLTMYGDEQSIQQYMGVEGMNLTIQQGGAATLGTEAATWSVSADGAVLNSDYMGTATSIPLKMVDDQLVLDLDQAAGGMGMFFMFKK